MRWSPLFVVMLVLASCGNGTTDLCGRFYHPYPNLIGERPRTNLNGELLDAMVAYDRGDFLTASDGLAQVIARDGSDNTARMYLASALLGAGEPYKAEMHLDFLERLHGAGFKDQVEWYNTLCWLCSGQYERALAGCNVITRQPRHTYTREAQELTAALTGS